MKKIGLTALLFMLTIAFASTAKQPQRNQTSKPDTAKANSKQAGGGADVPSTVLMYQVNEPGIKPYVSRYIINKQFIRIDDGVDKSEGYVLFDRGKKEIYSVSRANRRILVVKHKTFPSALPAGLGLKEQVSVDKKAPKIQGQVVKQVVLLAKKKKCMNLLAAKKLLPKASQAIAEYNMVLAGQHFSNLAKTPKEMQDSCFNAYHVYRVNKQTDFGLAILRAEQGGKQWQLVDFKQKFDIKPSLFRLPEKYQRFQAGGTP